MNNKAVLVTGCSTGIGLCLAVGLQKRGYKIFATARKDEDINELKDLGLNALYLDYAASNSIKKAFNEVLSSTNNLYAVIHNGAYGQVGALADINRNTLKKQFETNVFGWHELTYLALPIMRKQGFGRIVYISSILGFVAMPHRGPYNASKYAIEGLVDTLRLEHSNTNIQFSLIEPGPIRSNFRKNAYKAFKENVDITNSYYKKNYKIMIKRLNSDTETNFTLGPEAVLKASIHAIESKKAKIRYRITFPTKLFAVLKRILSSKLLDKVLAKIA